METQNWNLNSFKSLDNSFFSKHTKLTVLALKSYIKSYIGDSKIKNAQKLPPLSIGLGTIPVWYLALSANLASARWGMVNFVSRRYRKGDAQIRGVFTVLTCHPAPQTLRFVASDPGVAQTLLAQQGDKLVVYGAGGDRGEGAPDPATRHLRLPPTQPVVRVGHVETHSLHLQPRTPWCPYNTHKYKRIRVYLVCTACPGYK